MGGFGWGFGRGGYTVRWRSWGRCQEVWFLRAHGVDSGNGGERIVAVAGRDRCVWQESCNMSAAIFHERHLVAGLTWSEVQFTAPPFSEFVVDGRTVPDVTETCGKDYEKAISARSCRHNVTCRLLSLQY